MNFRKKVLVDSSGNIYAPVTHPSCVVDDSGKTIEERILEIIAGNTSQWNGKVWDVLGDSITEGYLATETYHDYIKENIGCLVYNYGISGTEICTSGTHANPFVSRYMNMNHAANLITVFGGVNDYLHGADLGIMGSTDPATFYGALSVICKGLYDSFPNAKYGFLTPLRYWNTGTDNGEIANTKGFKLIAYVNAVKEVCAYYSIPVLDLYNMSGITPYVGSVKTRLVPDGLHPNADGHKEISTKIKSFIESL